MPAPLGRASSASGPDSREHWGMRRSRSRPLAVALTAALTLAVLATAATGPASAKSDPLVDAFVKGFVGSFEKSSGVPVPPAEARCIGEKFLAKISVAELTKTSASGNLSAKQKTVLVSSLGACMSPKTYKAVLTKKLGAQFSVKQKTCIADTAITKIGVPKLLDLDFATFTGVSSTATQKAVTGILTSCLN